MPGPSTQQFLMVFDKTTKELALELPLSLEQAQILKKRCIVGFEEAHDCYEIETFYMEFVPDQEP